MNGAEGSASDVLDVNFFDEIRIGLASVDERGTTCCYAQQDKFWVEGTPDGERWEVYTVLADSETFGDSPQLLAGNDGDGEVCCGGTAAAAAHSPAAQATPCC